MTTASGRNKRLFMLVGLLLVLVLGLLWHAGSLMQTTRKEVRKSVPAAAAPAAAGPQKAAPPPAETAGEGAGRPIVRKALPSPPPPVAAPPPPPVVAPSPPTVADTPVPAPSVEAPIPAPAAEPPAAAEPAASLAPEPPPATADSPAPAAAASPPPSPAPPIAAAETPLPFSLLLSSCRDRANALAALPQFRRAGASPHIVRTEVKGKGEWWRVMSGTYRSAEEAAQAKKALGLNDAVVVRTPFTALIGEFPSEAAAADAAARASAKGVFPYVLPRPAGAVGLAAGAYLTQAEAEGLQRELKAQGVATKVVRR